MGHDSLVEYLKVNKSKFSWAGTFTELIEFTNKYLHLGDGVAKVIDNENKKTIKSDHLILNWCILEYFKFKGRVHQVARPT